MFVIDPFYLFTHALINEMKYNQTRKIHGLLYIFIWDTVQ
jgi:hypothetical protein